MSIDQRVDERRRLQAYAAGVNERYQLGLTVGELWAVVDEVDGSPHRETAVEKLLVKYAFEIGQREQGD